MKKNDIKRLEKVIEHYLKIEELLDKTYDSVEEGKTEYIVTPGVEQVRLSTSTIVNDMLMDARNTRRWADGKLNQIKEQLS